jgi:hypothetical protein
VNTFPLDFANDIPAYIASLFFLVKCGFNKFCPYWYNGFVSFHTFFPGWQLFTYPIYKLFKDYLLSTYVSIVLMYVLSFIALLILGKNEKFSVTKRIAFFLFFFANAINIGNFFKLGRVVELFSWCIFLGMAVFVFYYRKNRLDKKFILFIPLYGFAILSHPQEAVLSSILILSLFLVKDFYEKLIILITVALSFIITSFWWIPFLLNLSKGSMIQSTHQGSWLWGVSGSFLLTSIAAFFVPLVFFVTFYYYWLSNNKSKQALLFFSPALILSLLFFFRITPLIPIIRSISPDPFMVLLIFFIIYFFFSTNPDIFSSKLRKILPYLLIGIVLISVGISHFKTPYSIGYSPVNKDTLDVLDYVDDKFIFVNSYKDSYPNAYYSYAPIYLNLSTAGGWYPYIKTNDYIQRLGKVKTYLNNEDCKTFISESQFFNVTNFVAYEDTCQKLKDCNLSKVTEKNIVCLYRLNNP